jgi:ABC-type polysaccharide/polyol phosphate transport system ATPase subunit
VEGPRIEFREVRKSFRMRNRSDALRDAVHRGIARLFGRRSEPPKRHVALDGVSFRVAAGEALGVVGPNGAGKSTTLKLAAGVLRPDSGEVGVAGRVAALIELSAGFHPDLSGRENIFLGGALLGLRRQEIRAVLPRIAEFADLGEYFESPVRTYSSGMAVRLGFAVAAFVPAEVLLVDEVLAVGDINFRAKCMDRMVERRREGVSTLFVSHHLDAVESFCDRAVFIDHGRVHAEGPPPQVIAAYRDSQRARAAARPPG